MKELLPVAIRLPLARLRQRFGPSARKERRDAVRAEQLRVEGFRALASVAGRGDIREIVLRGGEAELVVNDGRRFRFDPADRLQRLYSLPVAGEFERKETEWVRRTIRTGAHCADAGGSFGWYAVLLAQLAGESGRVDVFEPIPRTAKVLSENLRRNGCANARIHALALAETEGTVDLYVPDIGVSGSLRLHEYARGYEVFACPVRTLDGVAAEENWSRLDFIKADVEGAELALLRGAERALARWRPLLLIEVQADSTRRFGHEPRDVFDWLRERRYRGAAIRADGLLVACSGREAQLPDYNFAFVPEERTSEFGWVDPSR